MSEENKAVVRRFYDEVVNGGDLDKIDELCSPDLVEHEQVPGFEGSGREIVRAWFSMFRGAFPDLHADVKQLVAEGDLVAAFATFSGTHQGEFMGIPPTGKQITLPLVDLVRFRDGVAVEHWGVSDSGAMLQQLGVIPAPAGVPA